MPHTRRGRGGFTTSAGTSDSRRYGCCRRRAERTTSPVSCTSSPPSTHGQMDVLVKRNGLRGTCYMAGIKPFRHLIVYPLMPRELARTWQARAGRRE